MNTQRKNKKILTLAVLGLLGASVVTGNLYGYWAEGITAPDTVEKQNNTVDVGKGKEIKGELVVTDEFTVTEKLVPTGRTVHSDGISNVEFVQKDLTTKWNETTGVVAQSDNVRGTLKISATAEFTDRTDGSDKLNELLNFTITSGGTDMIATGKEIQLKGETINSQVRFTLTEPSNKADYDSIKGRPFKVKLTYTVSDVTQ